MDYNLVLPCKPKDLMFVFYKDHYEESTASLDSGPPTIIVNCCVGWITEWDESIEVIYEHSTAGQKTRTIVLRGDLMSIVPVIKPRTKKPKTQKLKESN